MDKYTKGYLTYIEETKDIDMSEQYEFFMQYVPKGSKILDAGFGSGRDIAFFKQHYDVTGIDLSQEFVDYVKTNIHQNVQQMDILNLKFDNEFDAIWACASLVHFNESELHRSFEQFQSILKKHGILYASFKTYGNELIINNIRYSQKELYEIFSNFFLLVKHQSSFSDFNDQTWTSFILLKVDSSYKNI